MNRVKTIEETTEILKEYWIKHPELRLGQLLINLAKRDDIFYIEDDKFHDLLENEILKNERNDKCDLKEIEIGDYIEGFESSGSIDFKKIKKVKGWVTKIHNYERFYIMADDSYQGYRETTIDSSLGFIKRLDFEYKNLGPFKHKLKEIIEVNNNCKNLQIQESFNSFWISDSIANGSGVSDSEGIHTYEVNNELRILFLKNLRLTVSRVCFSNRRKGCMTLILQELINFCKLNKIKQIVIQSVLTKEMADFCLKNNFEKSSYMYYNQEENFDSGDYILYIK